MSDEVVNITVINKQKEKCVCDLYLYEADPNNEQNVKIELYYNDSMFVCSEENYFEALRKLRLQLEKEGARIICEGAKINVYPSSMQLSMGSGRTAYRIYLTKQAKSADIVDIFEPCDELCCVSCEEQQAYYLTWIKSLK